MLKTSGKLAVVLVLIGVLNIIFNVVNGQVVFVIEVFDIATDILLGFVYILCLRKRSCRQRISSDFRLPNKKLTVGFTKKVIQPFFVFVIFLLEPYGRTISAYTNRVRDTRISQPLASRQSPAGGRRLLECSHSFRRHYTSDKQPYQSSLYL